MYASRIRTLRQQAGMSQQALGNLLGLSADYVLFGEERSSDTQLLDKIHRIDARYIPLLDKMVTELLAISGNALPPKP